jgi:uncharacterized protein (TIGR02246 family)
MWSQVASLTARVDWNGETKMKNELETFAKAWDGALNSGDMAKLAGFYANSGRVIPAGGEPVEGRDAIADFFAGVRANGLTKHEIKVNTVVARGDTAVATGTWNLSGSSETGDGASFGGNWVNVLARDGAGWTILLHTWN